MARFLPRAAAAVFLIFVTILFPARAFAEEGPSLPAMALTPVLPSVHTFGSPVPPGTMKAELEDAMPDMLFWNEMGNGAVLAELKKLTPTWPVRGVITSPFGPRGGRMHQGIDIPVPLGTPVQAALAGVVVQARVYNGYGKTVVLDHGGGIKTLYAHCSELLVKQGDRVDQGEVIASAGDTGRSTAYHVHFGVFADNTFLDPMELLHEKPKHFAGQPQL